MNASLATGEHRICGLPGSGRWSLINDGRGMSGHGLPDDHPMRNWFVAEFRGSRSASYETALCLTYALTQSWVPDAVKSAIRERFPDLEIKA